MSSLRALLVLSVSLATASGALIARTTGGEPVVPTTSSLAR
jgi:hypothetical protein